jgi:hypothetical protein
MATEPIDYITAVYGTPPWTTLELAWDGTNTDYTLFLVGTDVSLVNGAFKSFTFVGNPDTRYDFILRAETALGTRAVTMAAYTAPLPPPSGIAVASTTSTQATLTWQAVQDATYEVADVADAYTVISTPATTTYTATGLTPNTRNSYAVRSVLGTARSRWSSPVTLTTASSSTVAAGTYTFTPTGAATWKSGRPGSSDPGWRPSTDDRYHGDGWVWGDTSGIQSTYLFYGSPNPFLPILGATVSKIEVYLDRSNDQGDPGEVLSHWFLHGYSTKPTGEPTPNDSVYDIGLLPRGASGWFELPIPWAYSLITNGAHKGIGWGGVPSRYQASDYQVSPGSTQLGSLRITVA